MGTIVLVSKGQLASVLETAPPFMHILLCPDDLKLFCNALSNAEEAV